MLTCNGFYYFLVTNKYFFLILALFFNTVNIDRYSPQKQKLFGVPP